jgi:Domain of unknown function (DUF4279)
LAPSITTCLEIAGDELDPDVCTKSIGIQPTRVRRAKVRVAGVAGTSWAFGFEKVPLYSTSDAVEQLLAAVEPHKIAILDFVSSPTVELAVVCNVTITDERPEYCLSQEVIRRLASWGAEFALDIFDYSE